MRWPGRPEKYAGQRIRAGFSGEWPKMDASFTNHIYKIIFKGNFLRYQRFNPDIGPAQIIDAAIQRIGAAGL
jgi:hypothetical protein